MSITWEELKKELSGDDPAGYIQNLHETGALEDVLPEVEALFGVPQNAEHHPEIDTGVHTVMALKRASELTDDVNVRFAALVHDLGKGLTPKDQWPKHIGHEEGGVQPVMDVSQRLGVPEDVTDLATKVTRFHLYAHRSLEMRPGKIVKLLENIGAFDNPEMLEQFVTTVQADAQGRLGKEDTPYPQASYLRSAFQVTRGIDSVAHPVEVLKEKRNEAVADLKSELNL